METKSDRFKTWLAVGAVAALVALAVLLIGASREHPQESAPDREAIIEHLTDNWAPGGP